MPRTAGIMAFPEFRGFTRKLILWNIGIYFFLLVLGLVARGAAAVIVGYTALSPALVAHGYLWQLVTYSFLHAGIFNTALELSLIHISEPTRRTPNSYDVFCKKKKK